MAGAVSLKILPLLLALEATPQLKCRYFAGQAQDQDVRAGFGQGVHNMGVLLDSILACGQGAGQDVNVHLVLLADEQGQHNEVCECLFTAEIGPSSPLSHIGIREAMAYIILDLFRDPRELLTLHLPRAKGNQRLQGVHVDDKLDVEEVLLGADWFFLNANQTRLKVFRFDI